jgi:DNA-binding LytR/AlgR family response regulator
MSKTATIGSLAAETRPGAISPNVASPTTIPVRTLLPYQTCRLECGALTLRARVSIAAPLTPVRFGALAAFFAVAAASYCLAHGFVAGAEVDPRLSFGWGISSTLPWWCAWEAQKRVAPRVAAFVLIAIAALAACATLQFALNVRFFPEDHGSFLELLYLRTPYALASVAAALILLQAKKPAAPAPALQPAPLALSVPTRHGEVTVLVAEIDYVKAAGNYVELATGDRTLLLRSTLRDLEGRLEAAGFERVHRSVLVNRSAIAGLRRDPKGRLTLKLKTGLELPIGRRYAERARMLC